VTVSAWQILLIAGSRDWRNYEMVDDVIVELEERYGSSLLILEGGCPTGADQMVRQVCALRNIPNITMHAHWQHGRGAGPRRNRWMAAMRPEEAHLFFQTPGSRGTGDMEQACREYGISRRQYRPS